MKIKDLHSERLDLMQINRDGLQDMHEYSTKTEFYKYLEFEPFKTIADTKQYLDKLIKRSNSENGHYWFIKLKIDKKIIGTFGLLDIDIRKGSTEIGYGISPDYWGGGYFKESLTAVLKHLFVDLQFHRVWAKTQINNIPSIRNLEKIGFKKEGVLRDYYLSVNGKRADAAVLSVLTYEFIESSI